MGDFWRSFRKYLINGFLLMLPLIITVWILGILLSFADSFIGRPVGFFLGHYIPGLGLLIGLAILVLIGWFTTNIVFKEFLLWLEKWLYKVPLVKTIYASVKQINDVLFAQKFSTAFRHVVLVEYPRRGVWSLGFVTGHGHEYFGEKVKKKLVSVFIATTPTPATGFVIFVPEDELIPLDISLEDAFKMVISAGVLEPRRPPQENAPG